MQYFLLLLIFGFLNSDEKTGTGNFAVFMALKKSFCEFVYCHSKPLNSNCFREENHGTNLVACWSGIKTLN